MSKRYTVALLLVALLAAVAWGADDAAGDKTYTNSLGMTMVRVPKGRFRMGSVAGGFDEEPVPFLHQ